MVALMVGGGRDDESVVVVSVLAALDSAESMVEAVDEHVPSPVQVLSSVDVSASACFFVLAP